MEFSNRTFGNAVLCGASRRNVFFAKLTVYLSGLFVLILIPLAASTAVATMRNGFGADWDDVALEVISKLLVYIFCRFSMAGFSILAASVIQNPLGTLGLSMAGIYLAVLTQNPMENPVVHETVAASAISTIVLLSAAVFIFIKRDIK